MPYVDGALSVGRILLESTSAINWPNPIAFAVYLLTGMVSISLPQSQGTKVSPLHNRGVARPEWIHATLISWSNRIARTYSVPTVIIVRICSEQAVGRVRRNICFRHLSVALIMIAKPLLNSRPHFSWGPY